jgi:TATA-binding related factor (TRF) of subunit 20 of Mediator complex
MLTVNASIFFLPATSSVSEHLLPSQLLFSRLVAEHNPEPLTPWTLEHRLFRETTYGSDPQKQSSPGLLQLLTLSYRSGHSYLGITKPSAVGSGVSDSALGPATIISVPSSPAADEFVQLIASRFGALWTRRQVLQVTNGQSYEVENFTVRFGEVREMKQGQGGVQHIRGTVVEVKWIGKEAKSSKTESIRRFWRDLNIAGAKEYIADVDSDQGLGDVQRWLSAMRLRA